MVPGGPYTAKLTADFLSYRDRPVTARNAEGRSRGSSPRAGFAMIQIFFSGPYAPPTLDYGQTHTIGTITCDSEPAGVTCTHSSTGHFFRLSRDSYQLR